MVRYSDFEIFAVLPVPDESSLQLELETNESIKDSQGMSAAELNKAGADFLK